MGPALTAEGTAERDVGEVVEVTPSGDVREWAGKPQGVPGGTCLLVRREIPHPGARLTFTNGHGYRYPLGLTNLASPDITLLEALYRVQGRCEPGIRDLKDTTGLAHLPSADCAAHQALLTPLLVARDLLASLRGIELARPLHGATPGSVTRCSLGRVSSSERAVGWWPGWRQRGREAAR